MRLIMPISIQYQPHYKWESFINESVCPLFVKHFVHASFNEYILLNQPLWLTRVGVLLKPFTRLTLQLQITKVVSFYTWYHIWFAFKNDLLMAPLHSLVGGWKIGVAKRKVLRYVWKLHLQSYIDCIRRGRLSLLSLVNKRNIAIAAAMSDCHHSMH